MPVENYKQVGDYIMQNFPIHPKDYLYQYILRKYPQDGRQRYFVGGRKDAIRISQLAFRLFPDRSKSLRILDFAAGYGRVVRHLPEIIYNANISASDIHPEACQFMSDHFPIDVYQSMSEPENLMIGRPYDLIYVLSFFSHLPDKYFTRWFQVLYRNVKPGGFLMLTANGEFARKNTSE